MKGLDAFHCAKKDSISEGEGSDGNTSQNEMHINAAPKDSESHMQKKGSNGNSKKNSNGLQVFKSTDMIESQGQRDTSNLSDIRQTSNRPEKMNYTVLTEKHLNDEKSSYRNSSFYIEDLGAEDEIFSLQCPKHYMRQNLINQTFDFGKLNKIVDAKTNEVLELNVLPVEKKSLTIAMPRKGKTGVLIKLPLKGHILIKKIVTTPFHHHEIINEDSFTCETDDKLSKDLKTRHPLLGISWKAHINLADEAFKRRNKRIKREMKKKLKVKTENYKKEKKFEAESLHLRKKMKMDLK